MINARKQEQNIKEYQDIFALNYRNRYGIEKRKNALLKERTASSQSFKQT